MRYHIPGQANVPIDRRRIALMLGSIIEAEPGWEAYMPTPGLDHFWTLDSGNSWKLRFDNDGGCEVFHRYGEQRPALFAYIAERMNWHVIE